MHENDAAEILCNLCFNEYMKKSAISEGKIELTSTIDGLFKVNRERSLRSIFWTNHDCDKTR